VLGRQAKDTCQWVWHEAAGTLIFELQTNPNIMSTITNLDLVTAFDLSNPGPDSKPVYQFVYGSQSYGTLFGVFARFMADMKSDGSGCDLKSISLRLLNYQGIINIGFVGKISYSATGPDPVIQFGVQGMNTKTENDMAFANPVTVKKGQRLRMIFQRTLHPLPGFTVDAPTRSQRNPADELTEEIPNLTYFDTEFQYRNGTGYFDTPLYPGMYGAQQAGAGVRFPSARCAEGIVNLYF
jgi:hypothetical protein